MVRLTVVGLLVALVAMGPTHAAYKCLKYEPEIVEVTGVLETKTFPGPPNYESIESGDRPETAWLLRLEAPICVAEGNLADLNVYEPSVSTLHLALGRQHMPRAETMKGKKVKVSGSLFHQSTGHHHASVLVMVKNITVLSNSRLEADAP